MLLAVLADIHGNYPALEAVLTEVRRLKVEELIMAGDVVGYGAEPGACIRALERWGLRAGVKGNHDQGVAGASGECFQFHPVARQALEWTYRVLERQELHFLQELPLVEAGPGFQVTHGSFDAPYRFKYVFSSREAQNSFLYQEEALAFVGHTHVPGFFVETPEGRVEARLEPFWELSEGERCLVNVGSVGQPRDGDPRACFVLWDTRAGWLELRRVEYDIAAAQRRIREHRLPPVLAGRLAEGT